MLDCNSSVFELKGGNGKKFAWFQKKRVKKRKAIVMVSGRFKQISVPALFWGLLFFFFFKSAVVKYGMPVYVLRWMVLWCGELFCVCGFVSFPPHLQNTELLLFTTILFCLDLNEPFEDFVFFQTILSTFLLYSG